MEAKNMDNMNSNDGFKQSNFKQKKNFNEVLTPFISGVVGASLVVRSMFWCTKCEK